MNVVGIFDGIMDYQIQKKLERLLSLKERIKPKTFFDQLEESGMLDDYINTYMPEQFTYDEKFQEDVLDLVFKRSSALMPNIQEYILENLNKALTAFQEEIKSD
jgi:hypothetical protein